jgi:hypothetical protein
VAEAVRRALSAQPEEQFPSVLDFLAAARGARPALRTAWLTRPPRNRSSYPPVIIDFEEDRRGYGRRIAVAALALALAGGGVWFGTSSAPAERAAPAPVRTAPAAAPGVPAPPAAPPAATPLVASAPRAEPEPAAPAPVARAAHAPVVRRPAIRRRAAPLPPPARRALDPGRISINALPWGVVSVDGRAVGNTPIVNLALPPGAHRIRVEREGFQPVERVIEVRSGQDIRITDIVLRELTP